MRWLHQTFLIALLSSSGLLSNTLHAQTQNQSAEQSAAAADNEAAIPITAYRTQVELIEKFSKVFETKNFIKRVNGFDPLVLNITALSPNRISVTGLIQGLTSLVITDDSGNSFTIEVMVKGDARQLQAIIDRKFPNSSIEAFKVQEAVALRGWVTHPEHITQIVEFAEQFYPKVLNQMRVGGVQQVLLKVKVMEAQRSVIRELGMNFTYVNRNGYLNSSPGSITSLGDVALPFLPGVPSVTTTPSTIRNATGSFGIIGNNNIFNAYITALRDETLLKILAEPEVVATNGRPATLLSGGEFPIIVPQSLGTVSIQFREFGVRLEACPIVLGGGSLRLELQPEVSERDLANAVTINGTTVPGLTVRRVNTQVEMKFGQTLMLAGLISNRQLATTHKIPFLGELPYIGAAFSRKSFTDAETEVVITVTPELVAPLDDGQVPCGGPGQFTDAPTDRELMAYGLIEVPKLAERCPTCVPGQAGPYVVPGLKSSDRPTDRQDLATPPAPTEADTSEQARRFAAQMAARQKNPSSSSGVRQTNYDEAAAKARASEATRAPAPANRSTSTSATRTSNSAAANRNSPANGTTSNKPDSSTSRKGKPGLIGPPAR
ncbi:MAG: type II and III secretion system protein family protein [Planctomycetaceae bacterium]